MEGRYLIFGRVEEHTKLLAEDPATGEQGYYEVVALTNHPTDEILQITIDSGPTQGDNEDAQLNTKTTDDQPAKQAGPAATMEVTPDHPVYSQQSQGKRPQPCGFTNIIFGLGNSALNDNLLKDSFEFAQHGREIALSLMPMEL